MKRAVRCRAPMRISLAGGGSDLPAYYEQEGKEGLVVNVAIARYAWATVQPTPGAARATGVARDISEAILEARQRAGMEPVSLHLELDAPLGSGLGGSSALAVAAVQAINAYDGDPLDPWGLFLAAWYLERVVLDQPGGVQDQLAAAYGGMNVWHITGVGDGGPPDVRREVIARERVDEVQHALLLAPVPGRGRWSGTRVQQQSSHLHSHLDDGDRLVSIAHDFIASMILRDPLALPRALRACHDLKERIDPAAITPLVQDTLDKFQLISPDIAVKLSGAGGGGHIVIHTPDAQARADCFLVSPTHPAQPITFDFEGATTWEIPA